MRTELTQAEKDILARPHPGDWGLPPSHWEAAKAYAAVLVAAEREACAQAVSECFIGDRARRAAERAIRARSRG